MEKPAKNHLGNVVDKVLVAVLRIHLAQLGQPLQVALDLVLLALQRQAVVHHRLGLFHLLWRLGISDGSPLHGPLVLCFLSSEPQTRLRARTAPLPFLFLVLLWSRRWPDHPKNLLVLLAKILFSMMM